MFGRAIVICARFSFFLTLHHSFYLPPLSNSLYSSSLFLALPLFLSLSLFLCHLSLAWATSEVIQSMGMGVVLPILLVWWLPVALLPSPSLSPLVAVGTGRGKESRRALRTVLLMSGWRQSKEENTTFKCKEP